MQVSVVNYCPDDNDEDGRHGNCGERVIDGSDHLFFKQLAQIILIRIGGIVADTDF